MLTFEINHIKEMPALAKKILDTFPNKRIFAFFGEMGAGKTTFIKAFCEQLQVVDIVCSPTFSIVNEYITKSGEKVFHFDFYRLKNTREIYDIGYESYFFGSNYCFIEWPEKMEELLPEHLVFITINVDQKNHGRLIQVRKSEAN